MREGGEEGELEKECSSDNNRKMHTIPRRAKGGRKQNERGWVDMKRTERKRAWSVCEV